MKERRNKKVKSTRDFGNFKHYILEKIDSPEEVRIREKYWKSSSGRKKLKVLFLKFLNKKS
ncbi:MAG: hypothetical protein A2729_05625 [Candidatus Buchananbacteria bacterium RIFCSPHIGHO2_01_FULL_39_14]|uniref:Uncharacterized protein n=2 Tax=Candidatus Buchananiibacteriota TaxID=1817903 RepID=A0A1G1YSI5_9BACT|nr:MAG: hypothetical protein A2729_05625 [Candidatus Buchananbacteria bacterium RIFCSPHIGHO2_01_FULL_39_14]OGY48447.1 MAG: hypothetical protein A3D39_02440 [Candidatus Buchananbacteria bacterium RIFCSPHIGHO2_02_FULL_39_17]OGY55313.1 MAG: hypothetical protein A2912_02645 [Candidatus Buchananbacteria bacterium RIFCSPLOWO2_01_FULL_40_23b]